MIITNSGNLVNFFKNTEWNCIGGDSIVRYDANGEIAEKYPENVEVSQKIKDDIKRFCGK